MPSIITWILGRLRRRSKRPHSKREKRTRDEEKRRMKRGEKERGDLYLRLYIWTPTNYSGDGRKSRHTHVKHIQHKTVCVSGPPSWNHSFSLKIYYYITRNKRKTYVEMLFQLLCCLIKSKTCWCCWCWWRLFSSLWLEDRATAMVTSMIAFKKSGTNQLFTRLRHGTEERDDDWRWEGGKRHILAPGHAA